MTMFIRITGCNTSRIGRQSGMPYIVVADMNGRQLRRTSPRPEGFVSWDSEAFICNDTLQAILLYVYGRDINNADNLLGVGKFDFNQVRGVPYQKININVPIVLQNTNTGTINLEAEYNEGQIFIGESAHMDLGSAVHRPPSSIPPPLMVAGTNTATIIQTPIPMLTPQPILPPVSIVPTVEQRTIASVGVAQDGLIPIQMVDFHPTHNLFSMWDVHYPDSKFRLVQPHLRKVIYRD